MSFPRAESVYYATGKTRVQQRVAQAGIQPQGNPSYWADIYICMYVSCIALHANPGEHLMADPCTAGTLRVPLCRLQLAVVTISEFNSLTAYA